MEYDIVHGKGLSLSKGMQFCLDRIPYKGLLVDRGFDVDDGNMMQVWVDDSHIYKQIRMDDIDYV